MKTDVVDLSVHNEVRDFDLVKDSGVRGVIHKATEGVGFVDRKYAERREAARKAGLRWGAYHFANNAPVKDQVEHFLRVAEPDDQTLLCLDLEDNKRASGNFTMSFDQAKEFLQLVYERTGQRPVLYSGNLLKEYLRGRPDPFISKHRLWLAQYASRAALPPGFQNYWLWQFSGDGYGGFGNIPGIPTHGIDVNMFGGADLDAEWAQTDAAKASPAVAAASIFAIPAADGPADYVPPPVPAKEKAKAVYSSPTNWSVLTLLGVIFGWVQSLATGVWDVIKNIIPDNLGEFTSDVKEMMSPIQDMAEWFSIHWTGGMQTALIVLLIAVILWRNYGNKIALAAKTSEEGTST